MTELKLKPTTYSISSEFIQNNLDTSKSPSKIGSEAALGWPFLFSQVLRSTPHWWCIFLVTFPTLSRVISKILWGINFDYDKGLGCDHFLPSLNAQCSLIVITIAWEQSITIFSLQNHHYILLWRHDYQRELWMQGCQQQIGSNCFAGKAKTWYGYNVDAVRDDDYD